LSLNYRLISLQRQPPPLLTTHSTAQHGIACPRCVLQWQLTRQLLLLLLLLVSTLLQQQQQVLQHNVRGSILGSFLHPKQQPVLRSILRALMQQQQQEAAERSGCLHQRQTVSWTSFGWIQRCGGY
jgi:hypothetical protein